jgi:hypothetical protein
VAGRRREAQDFLTGGSVCGSFAGGSVTVGSTGAMTGSGVVLTFPEEVPAIEMEVFVDCGEPGVDMSGDVEQAGVVSAVAEDEVTSRSLESRSGVTDSRKLGPCSILGSVPVGVLMVGRVDGVAGVSFGDAGGVGISRAC